jgi:hypothetical protein
MDAKTPMKNAKPMPPQGPERGTIGDKGAQAHDVAKHGAGVALRDRRAPRNSSIVVR